jgi:hypothetical protein
MLSGKLSDRVLRLNSLLQVIASIRKTQNYLQALAVRPRPLALGLGAIKLFYRAANKNTTIVNNRERRTK